MAPGTDDGEDRLCSLEKLISELGTKMAQVEEREAKVDSILLCASKTIRQMGLDVKALQNDDRLRDLGVRVIDLDQRTGTLVQRTLEELRKQFSSCVEDLCGCETDSVKQLKAHVKQLKLDTVNLDKRVSKLSERVGIVPGELAHVWDDINDLRERMGIQDKGLYAAMTQIEHEMRAQLLAGNKDWSRIF